VSRVLSLARGALKALLVLIMATLLAVMCLQIVMRYSFNASLIWAEEVCRYLLLWASMLGCMFAYERGEIAAVTLLREALPDRAALGLAVIANLAGVALTALLVVYGFRFADMVGSQPVPALHFLFEDSFGWPPSTVPTVFWVYAALPVGMALLGLRLLADTGRYGVLLVRGGRLPDAAGAGISE